MCTSNLQIVHDTAMLHGVDGAAASRQGSVAAADDLILSLNSHRSKRVALLLTDFPVLHWDILFGLNLSILISFLLTSNQSVSEYLSSFQLRFLFAVIVGVFSGTAYCVVSITYLGMLIVETSLCSHSGITSHSPLTCRGS